MECSAGNLTTRELAAAVHALERAAGQASFSPEYQNAIAEILGRAEGAAIIGHEQRPMLDRRIRDGLPEPEGAMAQVSGAETSTACLSLMDSYALATGPGPS